MNIQTKQYEALEILEQAINALHAATGFQIEIVDTEIRINETDYRADAMIDIGPYKGIYVETKRYAQRANIGALINQIERLPNKAILVADYINPRMAEKLRAENIQFIDTAGNAYINLDPLYVYIDGKKQNKEPIPFTKDRANRAFEPKGLMVTYAFLTDPELLNRPYREIATATDVALGTVGWVVNALKAGGYVRDDIRNKNRHIINYQVLLDRWVEAWPEKLRPKYFLGTFTTNDPNWWKNVKIEQYGGCWGGETAAAIYTNYLQPEIATVYIPKNNLAQFIQDTQICKEPKYSNHMSNIVNIYKPFWPLIDNNQIPLKEPIKRADAERKLYRTNTKHGIANPVLTYADLIATGDIRNIEAARIIYDERIARLNK